MKRNKLLTVLSLILVTGIIVLGIACAAPPPTPTPPPPPAKPAPTPAPAAPALPSLITMTAYPEGTITYVWAAAVREAVEKQTPMKMRVEPSGTDIGRLLPLSKKDTELTLNDAGGIYPWARGMFPGYGPQAIQIVWNGWPVQTCPFVRANAGINSFADLKGKKIPFIPGAVGTNIWMENILAFANLSWNDVVKVELASFGASLGGVLAGTNDLSNSARFTPAAEALAASPHGLKWLDMPETDVEGWKRAKQLIDIFYPTWVTEATGIKPGQKLGFVAGHTGVWSYDFLNEEVAYTTAKAMHLGYATLSAMSPDLKLWTIDQALDIKALPNGLPYHKGSIKYFKEINRWTSAHDQWQQEQLMLEKKRLGR